MLRNNIPNYDYVSDFVQGLRKLPIGNFVSFPAEIARTGTNIVRRALREINEHEITLANGLKLLNLFKVLVTQDCLVLLQQLQLYLWQQQQLSKLCMM